MACHTNHKVGCIKERIKLPVRKKDGIYINPETSQITVVCSVKQCTCHRFSFMEGELHNESNFCDA